MTNKFIDKDNGSIDEQFLVLSRRMEKAYKGMAENNVEKLKEELPPHYRYIEDVGKAANIEESRNDQYLAIKHKKFLP